MFHAFCDLGLAIKPGRTYTWSWKICLLFSLSSTIVWVQIKKLGFNTLQEMHLDQVFDVAVLKCSEYIKRYFKSWDAWVKHAMFSYR